MTKRFQCQHDKDGCTRCCQGDGYVYPSLKDIKRIAERFGISVGEFIIRYCFLIDYKEWYILAFKDAGDSDGGCCFLKEDGCSIYDTRPVQCETYPLWEQIVKDDASWEAEAKRCPGIGKGEEISDSVVRRKLKNRKRTHCIGIKKDTENIDEIIKGLSIRKLDIKFQ